MPVEIAVLTPIPLPFEVQREAAERMNPPLIAREVRDRKESEFTEFDGTLTLTLSCALLLETLDDVRRVLCSDDDVVPERARFLHEGISPPSYYERGMELLVVLTSLVGGELIIRCVGE